MIPMPAEDTIQVLVSGEQTGGRFAIIEARERQGAESPRHVHSREDEFIYILDGCLQVHWNGGQLDCRAGSYLYVPRGREHAFTVESEEARLLVMYSPAGLEACLDGIGSADVSGPEAQAVERLVALAAAYGVSITGPARQPDPIVAPWMPQ